MEKLTDWVALWRWLVENSPHRDKATRLFAGTGEDAWSKRAREFDRRVEKKWQDPDPIRDFLASYIGAGDTVLDIGAGTGRWSLYVAERARAVTAFDPSPSMLEVLRENIAAHGATNIEVLLGAWPDLEVPMHDVSLCSHAMYTSPDLRLFVRRMIEVTSRTCCMIMRVPAPDGVMGVVCQRLWGQPHDSPNFVVGYNALMQIGIYANVLMEPKSRPWKSESLEAALADLKKRLGLVQTPVHDEYLMQVLAEKLVYRDGEYIWPDGMRSALVYWDVDQHVRGAVLRQAFT